MLILKSFTTKVLDRSIVPPLRTKVSYLRQLKPPFTFITRSGFHTLTLAHMLDSLVRVSRRAESLHFVKVPKAISYHQTQSPDEKTTSIASYPNSPPNENPVHSKAHCRHLSLNHDNKPPRYNSQDRNLDLPPRQPFPAAYKLTLTSHRNTGHQQHHAQQKHRATKAASDAKARAPPPMKYAADYRHWIRFASLSAVSGTL